MQGNCFYNGIQLLHHPRFEGLKVYYVLNFIGDSGSLSSFDKILGFFLTLKNEDFSLSLQDNDLSMIIVPSYPDFHLCCKLCELSLWNWMSRGLELHLVSGKGQIHIAPWPSKIYYDSLLPESYFQYLLAFSRMKESTAFDSYPSKYEQSLIIWIFLLRFQLLQLLPISFYKLISILCHSSLTYRIGIRIAPQI